MKTQTLCLVKNLKKDIRCDKCDILLDLRTWKNKKIALSISKNKYHGFLCTKCISNSKIVNTFYRTDQELNDFVRNLTKSSKGLVK